MIIRKDLKNNSAERNQFFSMGLKQIEVDAVMAYKDLTNPQSRWDYKTLAGEKLPKLGMNCFMINGGLRNTLKQPLTPHDKVQISRLVSLMNSAIDKVKIKKTLNLIRGYTNPTYLLKYGKKDILYEAGFVSTSENREDAEKYALKDPSVVTPVISICEVPPLSNAIYLGKEEGEWLLKSGCEFIVSGISDTKIGGKDGLIYYLKKIK